MNKVTLYSKLMVAGSTLTGSVFFSIITLKPRVE
jgi:hypothetical protein